MGCFRYFYNKIKKATNDWLFPEDIKCFGCGKDLPRKNYYNICDKCRPQFVLNNGNVCAVCGVNVFGASQYCGRCKGNPRAFTKARAPLLYTGITKKLIRKFKYDGAKYFGKYFAKLLVEEYAKSDFEVDVVVPVPMSDRRKRERRYNHAEVIAQEFCKMTNLPIDTESLVRLHDTETQTKKSASERQRNLIGVFKVLSKGAFENKNVLLIDDVMTTGSTINECAKAIKANKIYALTVAHTPTRIQACTRLDYLTKKYIRKHALE